MPGPKSPILNSACIRAIAVLCSFLALAARAQTAPAGPSGYRLAATWKIPGDGRWDYMASDPDTARIYIARDNRVQVIDSNTGALLGEIPGLSGAHGVALIPGLKRGYATSGRDNKVIVFDLARLKPLGVIIPVGMRPDAILYDAGSNRVFVMDGGSRDISVIDPIPNKVIATIPLPGGPEFCVSDAMGRVFVNLEDKNQIAVIDSQAMKVTGTYSLGTGQGPTGLAIDQVGHHLFCGCANKQLVVLDDTTGNILATLPIGAHVDATRVDPSTGFAFASCGDGTLTVASTNTASQFVVLDTLQTKAGARTMTLDTRTHTFFVCTADFIPLAPGVHGRPAPVPGSFVVMKFTR